MFQRVTDDLKHSQAGEGGEEVIFLLDWAKKGRKSSQRGNENERMKHKRTVCTQAAFWTKGTHGQSLLPASLVEISSGLLKVAQL